MSQVDTILFDLDGTLLPMDTEKFMKLYFGALAQKCAEHGYEPEKSVAAVWEGTRAMVKNDGSTTNEERFWQTFAQQLDEKVLQLKPVLELFYENEFNVARDGCRENPRAAALVRGLRQKGFTVVLATNPLFPLRAVRTRLSWIGLAPEDFDHVTCYEHCSYCKPNTAYYGEILQSIGKKPENCLMVGNDVGEDGAAHKLGLQVYLVTDDLLNTNGLDTSAFASGSFADCCGVLQALAV